MLRFLFVTIFILFSLTGISASTIKYNNDSLILILDNMLKDKAKYEMKKQQRIARHLYCIRNAADDKTMFNEYSTLYEIYRKYKLDSAFYYAQLKLDVAIKIGNPDSIYHSKMNVADGLKGLGRFDEALAILHSIPKTEYVKNCEYYYYLLHSITLSLSSSTFSQNEKKTYNRKLRNCRDSIALVNPPNSVGAIVNQAEILKMNGDFRAARKLLESVQDSSSIDSNAIYWVSLADIYKYLGDTEKEKYCLLKGSIIDIRACVKTYTSLQDLAMLLYSEGDIDRAYKYITRALEDIIESNARSRLTQVAEYMPIITTAYALRQQDAHNRDTIYKISLCLLSLFLATALLFLYKRNKKLTIIRRKLDTKNEQLTQLNDKLTQLNANLNDVNLRLSDSNKIKEEYIAQLFNICSSYIDDMEQYRISLLRKVKAGKDEEMRKALNTSITTANLKDFFHKFDVIFLDLFPTFIESFNKLLQPDAIITPKEGELLTPEPRIYALVRLGINDSTKIANFLHYSSQTVYNYRMKIRNKAVVPKDQFVMNVQNLC